MLCSFGVEGLFSSSQEGSVLWPGHIWGTTSTHRDPCGPAERKERAETKVAGPLLHSRAGLGPPQGPLDPGSASSPPLCSPALSSFPASHGSYPPTAGPIFPQRLSEAPSPACLLSMEKGQGLTMRGGPIPPGPELCCHQASACQHGKGCAAIRGWVGAAALRVPSLGHGSQGHPSWRGCFISQ